MAKQAENQLFMKAPTCLDVRCITSCPDWQFQKRAPKISNEINDLLIFELNTGQNQRNFTIYP
jgi:hypothetical protein